MTDTSKLATRWQRLWAALIDAIVNILATLPAMSFLGVWEQTTDSGGISTGNMVALSLYGWVTFFVLHGYLLNEYGQTIGKYFIGTAIVTMSGIKPDFWPMILKRYLPISLVVHIPIIGQYLPMVDALFIIRKNKRCVHDLIAGTQVITLSANIAPQPTPKNSAYGL
jgi:uncharacterized RDD family membrane protein YckC